MIKLFSLLSKEDKIQTTTKCDQNELTKFRRSYTMKLYDKEKKTKREGSFRRNRNRLRNDK